MERKYLTVTALNRYIKYRFENDQNLQDILLKAEISNFKRHSRGHLYFTLKDENSQIGAIMFQSNAMKLTFEPKDGTKVIVEGYVSVYEVSGNYQVYVQKMSEEGVGDLYQAYEKLKAKLEAEGLFREEDKKELPKFPKSIGVITSPTGAAIRDIIHIINRRYPLTRIIIYPALVQGDEAKFSLVEQIRKANHDGLADVLIVGRGGGSIEDLWAFNEENVARAIHDSEIPIVSAVGHETDFTIADFVADRRSPTPSGAAEIVVPDERDLLEIIRNYEGRLLMTLERTIKIKKEKYQSLVSQPVLTRPKRILESKEIRFTNLSDRLEMQNPKRQLAILSERVDNQVVRLNQLFRVINNTSQYKLAGLIDKLELVNPLGIMKKGFALVKKTGSVIKKVAELKIEDRIEIQMTDGFVDCQVNSIRKDDPNGRKDDF